MKRRWWLTVLVFALVVPTVGAGPAAADQRARMLGALDEVVPNGSTVTLRGWAMNPSYVVSPVELHVYDEGPPGTAGYSGFRTGTSRPDVAAAFGKPDFRYGYSITVPLRPGSHRLCVYAIDYDTHYANPAIGCVSLTGPAVSGALDTTGVGGIQGVPSAHPVVTLDGWAFDPGRPTAAVPIHVYDRGPDGSLRGASFSTDVARPDVAAVFPGAGERQGFSVKVTLSSVVGKHEVCVYAISVTGLTAGRPGCLTITVFASVVGSLDTVRAVRAGQIMLSGWSVDPSDPASTVSNSPTTLSDFPRIPGTLYRPDVAAVYPSYGANHGFEGYALMTPGVREVCVGGTTEFGSNRGGVFGCRTVTMQNSFGIIDSVRVEGGNMTVTGWLIDPQRPNEQTMAFLRLDAPHVGLDSTYAAGADTTIDRPDVNAAFGVSGRHGFTATWGWGSIDPGAYDLVFSDWNVTVAARTCTSCPQFDVARIPVTVA